MQPSSKCVFVSHCVLAQTVRAEGCAKSPAVIREVVDFLVENEINIFQMPCPELLTEEEAIRYLRLDTIRIKNPGETLTRYRDEGLLRGTQVSKRIFYRRTELDRLLERLTDNNPR